MSEPKGRDDFSIETTVTDASGEKEFVVRVTGNSAADAVRKMKSLAQAVMAETDWGGSGP